MKSFEIFQTKENLSLVYGINLKAWMTTQTKCTGHKTRAIGERGRWREKWKNLGDDVNCQKINQRAY